MQNFQTFKAAKAAGFRPYLKGYYGGQQVVVKGRVLAKDPRKAASATAWGKLGFRVKQGAEPHAWVSGYAGGSPVMTWAVYRDDQVEPKAPARNRPRQLQTTS